MENMAEILNKRIISKKSVTCVGLDPSLEKIPECYKKEYRSYENEFEAVGKIIFDFNKDVINCVCDLVPAVKPQIAFYEQYGVPGLIAFKKTVDYARKNGLIVIEDGKRNDIGNTAMAYANAHLGTVHLLSKEEKVFDLDWLTVSPFLGGDGIEPFIEICKNNQKGIFILVRTSNNSAVEIQDNCNLSGDTISIQLAKRVNEYAEKYYSDSDYSPIGAVVGATYPAEAKVLREVMPKSIFLVPGYGAQGGAAKDIINCFNEDGLGAVVNASRSILYAYLKKKTVDNCTKEQFKQAIVDATKGMNADIYTELAKTKTKMAY